MVVALNDGLYPDEGLDVGVESVTHQLKLSVGRDKRDGSVVLKPENTIYSTRIHYNFAQLKGSGPK